MKVILLKEVTKLGHAGEVKNVKEGYARNFLFPQNLATLPTDDRVKAMEKKKLKGKEKEGKLKDLMPKLQGLTLEIQEKGEKSGHLYGSIDKKRIIAELKKKEVTGISEQHIVLDQPIKECGKKTVTIKGGDNVQVDITLDIKAL